MSYNYAPNYMSMIQALQSGGVQGASALKQARASRGLAGRQVDTQKVSDEDIESVQEKLLKRFSDVQEDNKSYKEQLTSLVADIQESGGDVDPVTGEVEPPIEDSDINTSGDIIDFIAGFEGFAENAYDDYGQLTIGFGTPATSADQTITKEDAMKELSKEVMKFRTIVLEAKEEFGYDWSENQIDALTSFAFNLGQGNFNKLLTGDEGGLRGDEEISEMILEYNTAGGKVLPGLTKRRQAEADLFTQGYN
jgi:GH24 family phage-related lysozyme (muramidase)